eukprot:1848399-Prymnesium_polylepis.3
MQHDDVALGEQASTRQLHALPGRRMAQDPAAAQLYGRVFARRGIQQGENAGRFRTGGVARSHGTGPSAPHQGPDV